METKPSSKTAHVWRRVFNELKAFVQHDNVGKRVTIDVKGKPSERRRGCTDDEAAMLLAEASKQTGYKRWVPWLCAFIGARLSEICQLRMNDVQEVKGIWCLHFTAEAGSPKNENSDRWAPLHSALIREGFICFVQSTRPGPIFQRFQQIYLEIGAVLQRRYLVGGYETLASRTGEYRRTIYGVTGQKRLLVGMAWQLTLSMPSSGIETAPSATVMGSFRLRLFTGN